MKPNDLRAYRINHSLPQAKLAEVLGISRHAIMDMESGRQTIPQWMGLALAAHAEGLLPYAADQSELDAIPKGRALRVSRALRQVAVSA